MYIIITLLLLLPSIIECRPPEKKSSLRMITVVFRHGARTPEGSTLEVVKPKLTDPSFSPYGIGELTLMGKIEAYRLGRILRHYYHHLIGPRYYAEQLEAYSSHYDRAQMSLQSCLYGLYPAAEEDQIVGDWQPVLFTVLKPEDDTFILPTLNCPECISGMTFDKGAFDPEEIYVYDYVQNHTGQLITQRFDLYSYFDYYKTTIELGMPVPEWIRKIYPQPLEKIAMYLWEDLIKQRLHCSIGGMLKKINKDAIDCINGKSKVKVHLISGHDANIYCMLGALDNYHAKYLNYTSYLVMELHEHPNNIFKYKIYLQNYDTPEPRQLSLPGCGFDCTVDDFYNLTKEYFLNGASECPRNISTSGIQ